MRLFFKLIGAVVFLGWLSIAAGGMWIQHKLTSVSEQVRAEQRADEVVSAKDAEKQRMDDFYGHDRTERTPGPGSFASERSYRPGKPMVDPNPSHRY